MPLTEMTEAMRDAYFGAAAKDRWAETENLVKTMRRELEGKDAELACAKIYLDRAREECTETARVNRSLSEVNARTIHDLHVAKAHERTLETRISSQRCTLADIQHRYDALRAGDTSHVVESARMDRAHSKRAQAACQRLALEAKEESRARQAQHHAFEQERRMWSETTSELAKTGAVLAGDLRVAAGHLDTCSLQRDQALERVERQDREIEALGKALTAVQTRGKELLQETRAQRAELVTLRAWKATAERLIAKAAMSTLEAFDASMTECAKWQVRAARWKRLARSLKVCADSKYAIIEG